MPRTEKPTHEINFEDAIEACLLEHGGYTKGDSQQFNAELAFDTKTLLSFIKETQGQVYNKLTESYGTTIDTSLVKRIAGECDQRGMLDVLRNGVQDRGQMLKLAYFQPPTRLNPDAEKLYAQNQLMVMRQVYYDLTNKKSIDLLLLLNGLPIATVELKNPFTGQRNTNAIRQYIKDREPTAKTPLLQFKKRALVHFAVDTDEAYMTTKLEGSETFFLPFNTGNHGSKGNPDDHHYQTGYKTGYLWEQIWQRDSWIDIIQRFIHLHVSEDKDIDTGKITRKETLIFPRYHQLDATRKLVQDAQKNGAGKNYLIQHSAGSGKTNTIAWTAHQLACAHNIENKPLFNSVIVISDRRNLDKQLQDNIYQIEHKHGFVAKIDDDRTSSDLAKELNKGTKIIITTLQKFSYLMGKVNDLSHKNFAVIVDEAHSSQGSKHSGNLIKTLGAIPHQSEQWTEEDLLAASEKADQAEIEPPDLEDLILDEAKSRGKQPNISFFAFTATPKHKTLTAFGVVDADGNPQPFHLYSMRQAIEENFILDVLKHYLTYNTYYKLSKAITDDPELNEKKAKKEIARFMSLHPYNIAQKTEIMLEHFRQFTQKKINGRAKAMVVTPSRLHAVRYKLAFDKYILEKGYRDIKTLVAFSGHVEDPKMVDFNYTEAKMNGFSESELPHQFNTGEYQVLIVAEKYQTGFDQPLLHTLYIDKKLKDLKAVQTLSRLNRTTHGKNDTFILDFANTVDDIQEAFKPYFEQTRIDEPTDPNLLYTLSHRLHSAPVLRIEEINAFATIYFQPLAHQTKRDHGQLNRWIDPAVERYKKEYKARTTSVDAEIYTEEGEEFKSTLQQFIRLYSFLSQVIDWQDTGLERLYAYGRHLLSKLPYRHTGDIMQLDHDLELMSYRNEKTFEGSAALSVHQDAPVYGPSAVGTARTKQEVTTPLSIILDSINKQFGTNWTDQDKLLIDQIKGDLIHDEALTEMARVNSKIHFEQVFKEKARTAFIERHERNQQVITDFMSIPELSESLISVLMDEIYTIARASGASNQ